MADRGVPLHFDVGSRNDQGTSSCEAEDRDLSRDIEHALASSPDALRFSATTEHDLLSPFCFNLQGERLEEDAAPFPYSPDEGEGGADHLERRPLPRRLDGERQDQTMTMACASVSNDYGLFILQRTAMEDR